MRASELGVVLPCTNWLGRPVAGLVVTLGFDLPAHARPATLATGGAVTTSQNAAGRTTFTFDLEEGADAIIVRWGPQRQTDGRSV